MKHALRKLSDGRSLPLHIEFAGFVLDDFPIAVLNANEAASRILEIVRDGRAVLLSGEFDRVDAVWRYLAHNRDRLLQDASRRIGLGERVPLQRAVLHRLLVEVQGDSLVGITNTPELPALREWVDGAEDLGGRPFLLPFRRLRRIISDARRQAEGLYVEALDARIELLPHVYVPWDQSVVNLFAGELTNLARDAFVLDMGTGTGVLALVAAKFGAARVVAVDISPRAVKNARLNIQRLNFAETAEAREAGDLFEPVRGEMFDLVLFNPPWVEGRPTTEYDRAIYDENRQVLRRFIVDLPGHLRPNGRCLMMVSDTFAVHGGRMTRLALNLAAEVGLSMRELARTSRTARRAGSRERLTLAELRR